MVRSLFSIREFGITATVYLLLFAQLLLFAYHAQAQNGTPCLACATREEPYSNTGVWDGTGNFFLDFTGTSESNLTVTTVFAINIMAVPTGSASTRFEISRHYMFAVEEGPMSMQSDFNLFSNPTCTDPPVFNVTDVFPEGEGPARVDDEKRSFTTVAGNACGQTYSYAVNIGNVAGDPENPPQITLVNPEIEDVEAQQCVSFTVVCCTAATNGGNGNGNGGGTINLGVGFWIFVAVIALFIIIAFVWVVVHWRDARHPWSYSTTYSTNVPRR